MYSTQQAFEDDARQCGYRDSSLIPAKLSGAFPIYQNAKARTPQVDPLRIGITIIGRFAARGGTVRSTELLPTVDQNIRNNFNILNERPDSRGGTLKASGWTLLKNDAWLLGGVHAHSEFHFASPLTWENLWDSQETRVTVTGRELIGVMAFGYTLIRPVPGLEVVATCSAPGKADRATLLSYRDELLKYTKESDMRALFNSLPPFITRQYAGIPSNTIEHELIAGTYFHIAAAARLSDDHNSLLKKNSSNGLRAGEIFDEQAAVQLITKSFRTSAQNSRKALEDEWIGVVEDESKTDVNTYITSEIGKSMAKTTDPVGALGRVLLIWVSQSSTGPEQRLPFPLLQQLIDLARGMKLTPMLLGDSYSFEPVDATRRRQELLRQLVLRTGDVIDLRRHYDDATFQTWDRIDRELFFLFRLCQVAKVVGIVGVKSSVLDGLALLGIPSLTYFSSDDPAPLTASWAGVVPNYHILPTGLLPPPGPRPVRNQARPRQLTPTEIDATKTRLQAFQQLKQSPNQT